MDFEYEENELQEYDKPTLLKIAKDYDIKLRKDGRLLTFVKSPADFASISNGICGNLACLG